MSGLACALLVVPLFAASADDPFAQGLALFKQGRYAEAAPEFRRALAAQPDSAPAHYYMGLTHSRQEHWGDAVPLLERALELDPDLPGASLNLGIAYYRTKRHDRAVKALARALSADPHNGSTLFLLGLSHQALGNYDESILYLERSGSADASYAQLAHYQSGVSHSKAGRPADAKSALERAVRMDPASEAGVAAQELLQVVEHQKPRQPWSLTAAAGFEFDDNVTTSENDNTSNEDDGAGVFELAGSYRLVDQPGRELEVGYDFYQSAYADLEDFNLHSHTFSVLGSQDLWRLDTGVAYRFTTTRLGNDRFLDMSSIGPSVGMLLHPRWYVNARWEFQNRNFHDNPGRDAHQTAVGLDQYVFFGHNRAYASLGYRYEVENADRPEYDYGGWVVRTALHTPWELLGPDGAVDLSYQYVRRDYDELTPSLGRNRNDRRHALALGLERRVTDRILGRARYQYVAADSNLSTADYDQNVVGVSLEYAFEPSPQGSSGARACPLWKSVLTSCDQQARPATRWRERTSATP